MYRLTIISLLSAAALTAAAPFQQPRRPLRFEPNQGQAPAQASWLARGNTYELVITRDAIVLSAARRSVQMRFVGGNPLDHIAGLDRAPSVSHYQGGVDRTTPVNGVPNFARLRIEQVYKGIDLEFYENQGSLEYDLLVRPAADVSHIQLAFDGADAVRVDTNSGDLVAVLGPGVEIRQLRPTIYQVDGSRRVAISGDWKAIGDRGATLALASYDHARPLVIDPTVAFSIPFGNGGESGRAVAVDGAGNAYMTGETSHDIPVVAAAFPKIFEPYCTPKSWDGFCFSSAFLDTFVAKFSPSGTLLFSTYLFVGSGRAIAVDSTGVFVTGWVDRGRSEDDLYGGKGHPDREAQLDGTIH
jgi:hypothetical protein